MTSAAPNKTGLPNNIDALKVLVLDKSAEVVEKEAEAKSLTKLLLGS